MKVIITGASGFVGKTLFIIWTKIMLNLKDSHYEMILGKENLINMQMPLFI